MAFQESEILKMMKKLDLSREEAIQLLQDDEDDVSIDLTEEQKKVVKKMTQGDRKKETAPRKRERKPDESKRELIQMFAKLADDVGTCVEVVNVEREILFVYNGDKYRITLMKPREKKE